MNPNGALPQTPKFNALGFQRRQLTKKTIPNRYRLPRKPGIPLRSLFSVALSCILVKHLYYIIKLHLVFKFKSSCPVNG